MLFQYIIFIYFFKCHNLYIIINNQNKIMTIINHFIVILNWSKKHENVAYEKSSSEQIVKVFTNLAAQIAFSHSKIHFQSVFLVAQL